MDGVGRTRFCHPNALEKKGVRKNTRTDGGGMHGLQLPLAAVYATTRRSALADGNIHDLRVRAVAHRAPNGRWRT